MTTRAYKVVLFDFDGTLFDTWPALCAALQKLYGKYQKCDAAFITELRRDSHLSRAGLLTKVLGAVPTAQQEQELIDTYQCLMLEYFYPYPGLQDALNHLNQRHIPWGIVTNKPKRYFPLFLKKETLLQTAACLICPEDVQNRKPDPEPLIKACELLKIKPAQALYIGDSVTDAMAAEQCRMDFALAEYGYFAADDRLESPVHHRLRDLYDLQKLIA